MDEHGDSPAQHTHLVAMLITAYLRDPKNYCNIPWLLDDIYLPEFDAADSDTPIEVLHPHNLRVIRRGIGVERIHPRPKSRRHNDDVAST